MITLDELLQDPDYRRYFARTPRLKNTNRVYPPWTLYLQHSETGKWHSKGYDKYSDAYHAYKSLHEKGRVKNAAIASMGQGFRAPTKVVKVRGKYHIDAKGVKRQVTKLITWKPRLPIEEADHQWCPYCRRPTIFRLFNQHHALNHLVSQGITINPNIPRCSICGASELTGKIYR